MQFYEIQLFFILPAAKSSELSLKSVLGKNWNRRRTDMLTSILLISKESEEKIMMEFSVTA